eukprot:3555228-Rhodomonas_salina.1
MNLVFLLGQRVRVAQRAKAVGVMQLCTPIRAVWSSEHGCYALSHTGIRPATPCPILNPALTIRSAVLRVSVQARLTWGLFGTEIRPGTTSRRMGCI